MSSSSSAAAQKRLEGLGVSTSSRLFQSPARRTLLFSLLLTAVVLVAFNPVTHNGFLNYDDDTYLTNNVHVRAGLTWATVKWAFTSYDAANYHPLTWLSHALDCQLFGLNPEAHHEINVLLHSANAVLLFLLLRTATGFTWRSLFVAMLFAIHPANVESVAWAAERKNVLSMLFFLLALHAYVWYTRQPGLRRYALIFLFFALALLSKPQVITFPFLLFLIDYWPLCRVGSPVQARSVSSFPLPRASPARLVLEKIPLLLLSMASAIVTIKAQRTAGAVQTLTQYSLWLRVETALIAYIRYVGKAVWPSKLAALYPHPTVLYPAWKVVAGGALLIFVTVMAVRTRAHRYLPVGWFWFLGSLVPMLGLVQVGVQAMADRYAYIPFIGLFLMLVWLVSDWAQAHRISTIWLAVPAVAYSLVLGTLTYRQAGYWHDIPSFWVRTLALTQDNYVAHDTLGHFLASQGRIEEAAAHFRAAIDIRPDDLPANLNLGAYEHGRGNLSAAIERYQMVTLHAADVGLRATAYGNLGSAYRQMGQTMMAKRCFEIALQLAPDKDMAMVGLGLIAQKDGDLPEAIRQYSHAIAVQPTDVGYLLLAGALEQEGRIDEAKAIFGRATRLSPNLAEAQKTAESLLSGK